MIEEAVGVELAIYVMPHCPNCAYARMVAARIQQAYPHVGVRLIDLSTTTEAVPESVFATPTYLLNGRVWSLGNPSNEKIQATLDSVQSSKPLNRSGP